SKPKFPRSLHPNVGTRATSTVANTERTKAAAGEGAEAALVIAPSYYRRQLTPDALRRHYHAVAEVSPIPILIYNIPPHMGYDLGTDWIISIAGHPNLARMKESSGALARRPVPPQTLGTDFVRLTGTGA